MEFSRVKASMSARQSWKQLHEVPRVRVRVRVKVRVRD